MNNFIEVYDNVLDDDICNTLIKEFEYNDSLKNTWRGVVGTGNKIKDNSVRTKIKDSQDFNLMEYFYRNNNKEYSLTFLNGVLYEDFLKKIFDITFNVFKKYNEKYDYHGEFINLKENNIWERTKVPKVLSDDYIKNNFQFRPHMVIKRYKKNKQGYHLFHCDFDDTSKSSLKRSHVCMVYLNDVVEGGETEWYYQKLKIKP